MTQETVEIFTKGQRVIWSKKARDDETFDAPTRYGDGPFVVADIVPVPTTCQASGPCEVYRNIHHPSCRGSVRKVVGHPQWVILDDEKSGTRLMFRSMESPVHFCGKWLIAAPK